MRRFTSPFWTVIGLVGGGTMTSFDEVSRILTVTAPDNYESLPTKIHAAFSWILANFPVCAGVFKIDDDIVLEHGHSEIIEEVTRVWTRNTPYAGFHPSTCIAKFVERHRVVTRFENKNLNPRHQAARYCYGHGYWVSRTALPLLVDATTEYATSYLEDVCTGYVLNRAGIFPEKMHVTYREAPRDAALLAIKHGLEHDICGDDE